MDLHKAAEVELGGLEDLDLADEDVLEGVGALAGLQHLLADELRDELLDEVLEVAGGGLGDDGGHLGADGLLLGGHAVRGLAELVGAASRESEDEHAELVAVGGAHIHGGLDESRPLLNKGAKAVHSDVHAVEVGEANLALSVLNAKADLAETLVLVLVEVSEIGINHAVAETISGNA